MQFNSVGSAPKLLQSAILVGGNDADMENQIFHTFNLRFGVGVVFPTITDGFRQ